MCNISGPQESASVADARSSTVTKLSIRTIILRCHADQSSESSDT